METLAPNLRKQLERTIADAREVAETGARVALEGLAVHHREPFAHMDAGQRALRQRLRARARQLGDSRDPRSGSHEIGHLVHECAYEHWHGMLFARFLAENRLLIEPELGVAVTLEECEELGKEEGADKWTMAARFAHGMLPQVFRPDHPAFEVRLAREYRLKLEGLVESLPAEVFAATDSLGWVYQFWQSRKKAEVNRSEVKVGADELPAVTQLFTEPYMVSFLLDNSLGAWWASRRLSEADLREADTEADLRRKAAVPGAPLDFLRFVRSEETGEQDGLAPCRRRLRGLAGAPRRPEAPRPLLRLGPLPGRRLVHAGSHAHGAGGPPGSRRRRRGVAGQPARAGAGPPLCRACGLRPRSRRLDVPRSGRVPPLAGDAPRLLRPRPQRDEGTVDRAGAAGRGRRRDAGRPQPLRGR